MKAEFIRIAAAKTGDPEALAALREIEAHAAAFEEASATLADRIAASKAARGEGPVKLSKAKREQLAELEADGREIDRDLREQLQAAPTAGSVIWSLHFGLSDDAPRARSMLKYYHPDERPIGEEVVVLQERLVDALAAFLERFPEPDAAPDGAD